MFNHEVMKEDVKEKILKLVEIPILKKGMEVVDIEWRRERAGWVLRLYIDKPGGVTIGDCAKISEVIGKLLDKEDLIHHPYNLEVSSPGIERPLRNKDHFKRFRGEKAKITLKSPIEGRRNIVGMIMEVAEDSVKLAEGSKVWEISYHNIKKAHLQPDISFK